MSALIPQLENIHRAAGMDAVNACLSIRALLQARNQYAQVLLNRSIPDEMFNSAAECVNQLDKKIIEALAINTEPIKKIDGTSFEV